MKEYRVGEVFTTDEGKTVQCVRSNGLCSGCVFLTNIDGEPRCKAMDVACSDCSRGDGQHVIFEELEAVAVDNIVEGLCEGCLFLECHNVFSTPDERRECKIY